MTYKAYTIRDRKANIYSLPFFSFNDETAQRDFRIKLKDPANINFADDMELYYIGDIDIKTGEITGCGKPVFIDIGVVNNAE